MHRTRDDQPESNDIVAPPASVSRRMSRTRGRDNPFEREVRSRLHAMGLRFRVHHPLPGMPRRTCDVAFPRRLIAVFLDGCFWHGCPIHATWPKANGAWWEAKLLANRQRDADTDERLRAQGWTVLRFWEHEEPAAIADAIRAAREEVLQATALRSVESRRHPAG